MQKKERRKMARQNTDGWIKISRKLATDERLWLSEPFTKGQAWIDLLLMASWKTSNGFKAGTVYTSTYSLADRWGWSRGKVRRFLGQLSDDTTIEPTSDTKNGTTILIRNWGKYQLSRPSDDTTIEPSDEPHYKKIGRRGKEKRLDAIANDASAEVAGDDRIPIEYRADFQTFEDYDRWRNR